METTGNRLAPSMTTISDEYKVSLYYPVLDAIIACRTYESNPVLPS